MFLIFNISEIDINTHKLLLEDGRVKDRPRQIKFMDIPLIIMGKKKFDCTYGVDRNRSLKKKILDEKVEKVYTWNGFQKMRKMEIVLKQRSSTKAVALET